jgi:alpha-D-ribose 1-methylphosphonate 5-triphosphate synthase subunit PhnG
MNAALVAATDAMSTKLHRTALEYAMTNCNCLDHICLDNWTGSLEMNRAITSLQADQEQRRRWMATLARTTAPQLDALLAEHAPLPGYHLPRPAETGLCMVRGRMGGIGRPFNLGEMTMTRCVVQLDDDIAGVAYVTGRDRRKAELAALADAMLQSGRLPLTALLPLREAQEEQRRERSKAVAATKVDFFTLVRGED